MGVGISEIESQPAPSTPTDTYTPTSDDLSLEAGIRAAYDATLKAGTPEAQRHAFRMLADLVANRSPGMVAHLERRRNLRP